MMLSIVFFFVLALSSETKETCDETCFSSVKFNPEASLMKTKYEFGEWGGVVPSIERASTFTVMEPTIMPEIFKGKKSFGEGYYLYSRHFNPTTNVLNRYLAAMEGSEFAVVTSSGMAAISSALLQLCKLGDHVISSDTVYGGTFALMKEIFPEMGIETSFVDSADVSAFKKAIKKNTKVFYVETVANPTLKIANIPELAALAHEHGIKLVVDNTFSPMMVSPIQLGADVVIHSLTKFVNGGSDLIGGAICSNKDFILELMDLHTGRVMLLGPTMDTRVAYDLIQRLPHLGIRMREHSRRALAIAERLYELGVLVTYPGLPSHPQHELFKSFYNKDYGFGGILTVDCGTTEKANKFMSVLQNKEEFGFIAVSLGFYETLMSCSGSSTSSEVPKDEQKKLGLSPGLVRMSIGITGPLEDRLKQIERAVKLIGLAN